MSKTAARRLQIRRFLEERQVGSQEELVALLGEAGFPVTQTTVSRDLTALGAVKAPGADGGEVYSLVETALEATPERRDLARLMGEFVVGLDESLNLAVLRTRPGAAGPVADALDRAALRELVGTVAGDDTVLAIGRGMDGGRRLASLLEQLLEDIP